MKNSKAFLFALLLVHPFSNAQSSEFLGVHEYIERHGISDLFHASAVMQRCAGVLQAYAMFIPTSMRDQKVSLATMGVKSFQHAVALLNRNGQNNEDQNLKTVEQRIKYYKDIYFERIETDQANTGSVMEGKSGNDLAVCIKILQN